MNQRWIAALTALMLVAGACSAKGDAADEVSDTEPAPAGSSVDADVGSFGDIESPCGEGDLVVDVDEGHTADTLRIGVPNDRSSDIRPGLNKEIWDASNAFVQWCNDQGGIGGLPIEIIDLDAALLEIESAMTRSCAEAFMMVGGGWVQDNLIFSGKPESDFHLCGMADIPAISVTPQKGESNGSIQPLPHVSDATPNGWVETMLELEPEKAKTAVEVWGDIPAMDSIKDEDIAALESKGVDVRGVLNYPITGLTDWTPLAQQVIDTGAGTLSFLGEPTNLGSLLLALRNQGWDGIPVLTTNMYDQTVIEVAGAENAEGMIVRTAFHPFEEADQWPAIEQFTEILNTYVPDGKQALLGMHSFSAWLLFAEAANACGEANDSVLTRNCILEAAAEVDDWTAGGLHAPVDPGPRGGTPGTCLTLLVVNSEGGFERLDPKIGSDEDSGSGFRCNGELVEVPGAADLGVVDPDRPI